ncbi:hypothetical protein ACYSNR_02240 [Enterococcus sp. LJL128]
MLLEQKLNDIEELETKNRETLILFQALLHAAKNKILNIISTQTKMIESAITMGKTLDSLILAVWLFCDTIGERITKSISDSLFVFLGLFLFKTSRNPDI